MSPAVSGAAKQHAPPLDLSLENFTEIDRVVKLRLQLVKGRSGESFAAQFAHEPRRTRIAASLEESSCVNPNRHRDFLQLGLAADQEQYRAHNKREPLADRLAIQLPVVSKTMSYNMFDDADGGDWQEEPHDWWQNDCEDQSQQPETEQDETVNREGESVQAALNARLRRTTRLTFFDDESGEEDIQLEPDDFNRVANLVDKSGWPEFAKATKFAGAWLGMAFKLGPRGLGYYRDVPKIDIRLMQHLPATADASPIVLQLDQIITEQTPKKHCSQR